MNPFAPHGAEGAGLATPGRPRRPLLSLCPGTTTLEGSSRRATRPRRQPACTGLSPREVVEQWRGRGGELHAGEVAQELTGSITVPVNAPAGRQSRLSDPLLCPLPVQGRSSPSPDAGEDWLWSPPLPDPNADPVEGPIRLRNHDPPLHLKWCTDYCAGWIQH